MYITVNNKDLFDLIMLIMFLMIFIIIVSPNSYLN